MEPQDHFDILVPKNGIVEDLINGVIKKAQIPDEAEAGKIRVFEVNNHKFFREMSREYPVISINEYTLLVAERMSPEEAEATEKEFINCFHFQNEPSRVHGMPFRFLLKEVSYGNKCAWCVRETLLTRITGRDVRRYQEAA